MLEILQRSKNGVIIQLRDQEKLLHKRNLKREVAVERRREFKGGIQNRGKHLKRNGGGGSGGLGVIMGAHVENRMWY